MWWWLACRDDLPPRPVPSVPSAPPTVVTTAPEPPNPTCGDAVCGAAEGESCPSCPADCDTRAIVCGNGECQAGETVTSCPADCGPAVWPADWASLEQAALDALTVARASGVGCAGASGDAAPALAADADLTDLARLHAWDQASTRYFDHTSCNGRSTADRAPTATHEAIAWGFGTPVGAVSYWLAGPGCSALLDRATRSAGLGYAAADGDPVWVLLVAP